MQKSVTREDLGEPLCKWRRDCQGALVQKALIYKYTIPPKLLDRDAIRVIKSLEDRGSEAYIVGGAVRDALIGKIPKDYDIATDAHPNEVKKVFHNSRVIGKRFRLVHIRFGPSKIIEVATFRSARDEDYNNVYGTMDEDAMRRDFTLNALYYSPKEGKIIDYHGGVEDILKGCLQSVIPLGQTFREDPVRMLRAIKYAVITGARIPWALQRAIHRDAPLIAEVSLSRISEEIFKVLNSGHSRVIFEKANKLGLLRFLLPNVVPFIRARGIAKPFYEDLRTLDQEERRDQGYMVYALTRSYLLREIPQESGSESFYSDVIRTVKEYLRPVVAPNRDVATAVKLYFQSRGWTVPRTRSPLRRRQKSCRG